MSEMTCPACGSSDLKEIVIEKTINEPFGGSRQVSLKNYQCEICDSSGDFFSEHDQAIQSALLSLKQDAVTNILNDFLEHKVSLSSMERALELPQRTLTKWKNGSSRPSSAGVALIKFLGLFPWLLEVAEHKYDYKDSQKIHMGAAFQKIIKCMDFNKTDFSEAGIIETAKATHLYLHFDKMSSSQQENDPVSCLSAQSEMVKVSRWSE
jgi:DNA-binding transcriptional regulator YiaG